MNQHISLSGMSGGPVFDMKGRVYGMDVATLTRKIPEANGIETIVPNGVAIDVVTIKKILTSKITLT